MVAKILWNKAGLNRGYQAILGVVFIAAFTVSCGKKGPLYIPKQTPQVEAKPAAADKATAEKSTDVKDTDKSKAKQKLIK